MRKLEYILLQVNKPEFTYDFHPNNPLILGDNPEVGLKSLFMWYTYPNISAEYNNNKLRLFYSGNWHDLEIPKGMYEVFALSEFLNEQIVLGPQGRMPGDPQPVPKLQLDINPATFKCIVRLGPGVKIDFSQGELHKLLGLEAKIYDKVAEVGPNIINVTRGVDKIMIRCSSVDRPVQHDYQDVLFDLLPFAEPGSAIQIEQDEVEFYRCKDTVIRQLDISITDPQGRPIDLSEPVQIKVVFKHG